MERLCSFRLVLEGKTGKVIVSAKHFALSDAEDNTSGPLNRGSMADLPLLRTLLAICQKSREPGFWEVIDNIIFVIDNIIS